METYTFLRELADSWVLLALCLFYIAACLFAFRPGAMAANTEAAGIPLRNDHLADVAGDDDQNCSQDCADCSCKSMKLESS